jgi:hypothetical protein
VSKRKTVAKIAPLAGELAPSADPPLASDFPAKSQPLPPTDTEPALYRETANPVVANPGLEVPPLAPVLSEAAPTEPPSPLLEPGPQLAPEPAAEEPPTIIDLALAPAVAQPVPLAIPAPEADLSLLRERIERLEEALAEVQNLQGIEQRVAERVAIQLQREKPATGQLGSPVLAKAAALLDAGKNLIPSLARQEVPPGPAPQPQPHPHPQSHRMWLVWETLAEARAILRMYVDPRYSLSWTGRMIPPILLAAFVFIHYWLPFAIVPIIGPIIEKAGELVVGFVLFKVLGHEARRYRETAPDLPPSLRL